MKKILTTLTVLMLITANLSLGQSILTTGLAHSKRCAGLTQTVFYTTTFPAGTELTVLISDSAGTINAGTLVIEYHISPAPSSLYVPTTGGISVAITLPLNMKASKLYRVIIAAKIYSNGGYGYIYSPNTFQLMEVVKPAKMTLTSLIACTNGSKILLNDSYNSNTSFFYLNFSSYKLIPSQINPAHLNVGTHTVTMTANNDATNKSVCGVQRDTAIITIKAVPTVAITSSTLSACQGDSILLTSTTANSYVWNVGGTTQSIQAKTSGKHKVTVTNNGCSNSDSVTIIINPLPSVPIITNVAGILSSSSLIDNQWFNSSGLMSGEVNQTLTPPASDNYTVVVTNNVGCSNTSAPFNYTLTTTGINSTSTNTSVFTRLFPNPTNDIATLIIQTGEFKEVLVTVISIEGKIILNKEVQLSGETRIEINAKDFPKGIYFVNVVSEPLQKGIVKPIKLIVN